MLAKPLTFLLVFLLALINFIVLLIPISILLFPLMWLFKPLFIKAGLNMLFLVISWLSGLMIAYVVFDTMFGITMRRMRKGCVDFAKASSVSGHAEIMESFEWLKRKFQIKNVRLFLSPSLSEVNAYAIGSFSGGTITITMGLINKMHVGAKSQAEFIDAIRGILGHEMSHLVNQDFLPGMLTNASEACSKFVSKITRLVFVALATIFRIIPWFGSPIANLLVASYNFVNFAIMAFFKFVFRPLYNFMLKFFGRSIEYRCDRESAYAYGGQKMAKALAMLGKGSYFSLFSTHPSTSSRIRHVENVLPQSGNIRSAIINNFSNFASMVLVVFICLYSSHLANMPELYGHFVREVYYPVVSKQQEIKGVVMGFYYRFVK